MLDVGQIAQEGKGVEEREAEKRETEMEKEKAVKYSRKTSFIWKQTFQTEPLQKLCVCVCKLSLLRCECVYLERVLPSTSRPRNLGLKWSDIITL